MTNLKRFLLNILSCLFITGLFANTEIQTSLTPSDIEKELLAQSDEKLENSEFGSTKYTHILFTEFIPGIGYMFLSQQGYRGFKVEASCGSIVICGFAKISGSLILYPLAKKGKNWNSGGLYLSSVGVGVVKEYAFMFDTTRSSSAPYFPLFIGYQGERGLFEVSANPFIYKNKHNQLKLSLFPSIKLGICF